MKKFILPILLLSFTVTFAADKVFDPYKGQLDGLNDAQVAEVKKGVTKYIATASGRYGDDRRKKFESLIKKQVTLLAKLQRDLEAITAEELTNEQRKMKALLNATFNFSQHIAEGKQQEIISEYNKCVKIKNSLQKGSYFHSFLRNPNIV